MPLPLRPLEVLARPDETLRWTWQGTEDAFSLLFYGFSMFFLGSSRLFLRFSREDEGELSPVALEDKHFKLQLCEQRLGPHLRSLKSLRREWKSNEAFSLAWLGRLRFCILGGSAHM